MLKGLIMSNRILRLTILSFGYAFLYIPLTLVIFFSFNSTRSIYGFESFSFKWYQELSQNEAILESVWNSFKIASISATFSTIIGTLAAFSLVRIYKFKGRKLFETLINMPLIIPEVVTGLSFLLFFVSIQNIFGINIHYGIQTISIAHITLGISYIVVIIKARLQELDFTLEESAMDLGAKPLTVFTDITLPLITPACLSGWLLSFALSFDDVVIASFVSSPESTTLPMIIFSTLRTGGLNPKVNALATIMILISTVGVIAAAFFIYRRQKKR
jgi:putrescine transport system permease protein